MTELESYVRRGHTRVQGWLQPEAARLIADLAQSQTASGAVGEIGVHHGKLFILLALCRAPGESAVALDLFERQELNVDGSGRGDYDAFVANLVANAADDSVVIKKVDSTQVSAQDLLTWAGGPYRIFSIDGGHTAEITHSDLAVASSALADGGVAILDDYFNEAWPGVSEGLARFMATGPAVVPFASAFGKTFLTQPSAADRHRTALRQIAGEQGWRISEQPFYGQPHVIISRRPKRDRLRRALRARVGAMPGATGAVRTLRRALSP